MIKLKDIVLEQSDVVGTGVSNLSKVNNSKITDLTIGQGKYTLEKYFANILATLGAIDINVTPNMDIADVSNEIKKLEVAGLLVPGQLRTITISTHGTGCGKFNYDIVSYSFPYYGHLGEDIKSFWELLAKFCNPNTKIFLGGCSVAKKIELVAKIAEICNCTVTAPSNLYNPIVPELWDKYREVFLDIERNYVTCNPNKKVSAAKMKQLIDSIPVLEQFVKEGKFTGSPTLYAIDTFLLPIQKAFSGIVSNQQIEKLRTLHKLEKDDIKKNQGDGMVYWRKAQTLIGKIISKFMIMYLYSLGCQSSFDNPIQHTRSAIFK